MSKGPSFSNGSQGGNSGPGMTYLKYVLTPEVLASRTTHWDLT